MLKKLFSKPVLAAIVGALIAIFAALPWATGLKYACMAEKALGGDVSAECVSDEVAE